MQTIDFNRLKALDPDGLKGARILDIGSGTGRHTCAAIALSDTFVAAADRGIETLDAAKMQIAAHRNLIPCPGKDAPLAADITALPFSDAAFDLVICSEVLEHIPNHGQAISEAVRVLKPGKILALSVPREVPERICWVLSEAYHQEAGGHVRIYGKAELLRMTEEEGLHYLGGHYAHSLHSPFWWLKCLLGERGEKSWPIRLYHRFLVWDLMKKPVITRVLDRILNPVMGKSLVLYLKKPNLPELPDS